jgi:hypothetical protein
MATQEAADGAIKSLNSVPMNGKPLKCSWGKLRTLEMSQVPMYSPPSFFAVPNFPPPFVGQVPPTHFPSNYYPPQWNQQEQQQDVDIENDVANEQAQTPTYPTGYYAPVYYT